MNYASIWMIFVSIYLLLSSWKKHLDLEIRLNFLWLPFSNMAANIEMLCLP